MTVWERFESVAEEFARANRVRQALTPAEAAAGADIVVTMLANASILLDVMEGEDGLLAGMKPGSVLVDCATIGAQGASDARSLCDTHGVNFVSSPVSGSTDLAAQGQLFLMIGGEPSVIASVTPVLSTFAKSMLVMGRAEAAAATKVAINGLLHTFNAGLAEMVITTERNGVERARFFDALSNSVLANAYLGYKRANYESPDHATVAFDLKTAAKDLDLAVQSAVAVGLHHPLIGDVLRLHQAACSAGLESKDMAALAEYLDQQATPNAS